MDRLKPWLEFGCIVVDPVNNQIIQHNQSSLLTLPSILPFLKYQLVVVIAVSSWLQYIILFSRASAQDLTVLEAGGV